MTTATWARLDNGNWGVRIEGTAPAVGAELEVTRANGVVSVQRITSVFKTFRTRSGQVVLCEVAASRAAGPKRSYRGGRKTAAPVRTARPTLKLDWSEAERLDSEAEFTQERDNSAPGAESLGDLLSKPSRLPARSTLTA